MCIPNTGSGLGVRCSELNTEPRTRNREHGVSLVELIVFIVIVSVAVAGVLLALTVSTRASADPLITKQALAIAEAMLEEVQLMPFTYCDPDDTNADSANSAAGCTGGAGGANDESKLPLGPETGETRLSTTTPFDNVNDYNTFTMTGVTDIANDPPITALADYKVAVTVAGQAIPAFAPAPAIPSTEALLITVTVTWPAAAPQVTVILHGYRVRYAPNALP